VAVAIEHALEQAIDVLPVPIYEAAYELR